MVRGRDECSEETGGRRVLPGFRDIPYTVGRMEMVTRAVGLEGRRETLLVRTHSSSGSGELPRQEVGLDRATKQQRHVPRRTYRGGTFWDGTGG